MADPAGYVYKDGAYWSTADGSGPYGVTPAGLLIPLFEFAYKGVWASRPAASAVPAGSKMCATDVGVGGYSEWVSDGTYWRPVNGSVLLFEDRGSVASPIASLTGDGVSTQIGFVIPNASSVRMPAGMAFVGSRIVVVFECMKGAVATVTNNFTSKLDSVTVSSAGNNPVGSISMGPTANLSGRSFGTAVVTGLATTSNSRATSFAASGSGFFDMPAAAWDFDSNPPYITLYIQGAALPAGELYHLVGYQVYFEG